MKKEKVPLNYCTPFAPRRRTNRRTIESVEQQFTIIFEPAEEGGFTAYIPEVPGAVSEGETKEEAREMVLDAMRELLAFRRDEALKSKSPRATIETLPISA